MEYHYRIGHHFWRGPPGKITVTGTDDNARLTSTRIRNVKVDVMNTVTLNVGGVRHEIGRDALQNVPESKLSDLDSLHDHYRKNDKEYYFDRHPGIFAAILNFYRTGELHMPQDVCGPAFKLELDFWGLDESQIQECCWVKYNVDRATRDTFDVLEEAHWKQELENNYVDTSESSHICCARWKKFRAAMWSFLDNPLSSKCAKVYAVVSFLLAVSSIAVFCAETHPNLIMEMTPEHYAEYYGVHITDLYKDWYGDGHTHTTTNGMTVAPVPRNNSAYNPQANLRVPHPTLVLIDRVLIALFTLDLVLRIIACPRKLRFFLDWLNIVDALSILPFYVEFIVEAVNRKEAYQHTFVDALFTLKVLRIFRILRLLRYYKGLQVLALTMKYSYKELVLLGVFLFICTIIFASLIYFTNQSATRFQSIPHSFWWAIITMTTVGYGDVVPTTDGGYFIGSLCALSGVLVIAFTVPTLVNNFLMFYSHVQYRKLRPAIDKSKTGKVSPMNHDQGNEITVEELETGQNKST